MSRIEAALNKARALARAESTRLLALESPEQSAPSEQLALTDGQLGGLGLAELSGQELTAIEMPKPLTRRQLDKGRLIHPGTSHDPAVNPFWALRTRVWQAKLGTTSVIQTVPVEPCAGGSFIAVNLAIALSLDESASVMLMDCNLREPTCHKLLGVDVRQGLIDFIETPDLPPSEIVYPTPFPRLLLIPAGTKRDTGSGYFISSRIRRLYSALRACPGQRAIVVDGPAASHSVDVGSLAELADSVLLVASYGRSTRATITAAASMLDKNKLLGVVFNNEPSVSAFL